MGSIFTMPVSGLLTRFDFDGGWPAAFYPFGKFRMTSKGNKKNYHQDKLSSIFS